MAATAAAALCSDKYIKKYEINIQPLTTKDWWSVSWSALNEEDEKTCYFFALHYTLWYYKLMEFVCNKL